MIKELFDDDYEALLNNQNLLEKSLLIVEKMFENITDKQGKPYIGHLLRVSDRLSTKDEKIVGLLHDIVEDTEVTLEDLKSIGYPDYIVEAIDLLTIKKEDDYHVNLVERLLKTDNLLAITVKKADIEDNMDEKRLKELGELDYKTAERLRAKYALTYPKIVEYLKKRGEKYVGY